MGQFTQALYNFKAVAEVRIDRAAKRITYRLFSAIVDDTPVDSGKAISNWFCAVDEPNVDIIDPYAPGKDGSTRRANILAAKAAARPNIGGAKSVTYITNNLPYIYGLEYGASGQAPAGMVRINIALFQQIAKQEGSRPLAAEFDIEGEPE